MPRKPLSRRRNKLRCDKLFPKPVSPSDLAKLLTEASDAVITEDMIRADIRDGAPVDEDGKINVVNYVAWLLKEMGRGKLPCEQVFDG